MRRVLARHSDVARVTGLVEPFDGERWRVEVKTPDSQFAGSSIGSVFRTGRGNLEPGKPVTILYRKPDTVVMSDTPDELSDLLPILIHGHGRVLVNGLGLGCVVKGLLAKDEVDHIDVVEIDPEIIEHIGPYYEDERVTIYNDNAFTMRWRPGENWNCVWHDVWSTLCTGNLREADNEAVPGSYEKLHRKYGGRCDWQGSWGREFLERERAREGGRW